MRRFGAALGVSLALGLLGWVSGVDGAGAETVIVTRGNAALPPGCTPGELAAVVIRFTEAFNRGDATELDGLFAKDGPNPRGGPVDGEAGFVDFAVVGVPATRFSSTEREELLPYVARRHRAGERLRLLYLTVGSEQRALPHRAFVGVALSVHARDLGPRARTLSGKVELNCRSGTITTWVASVRSPAGLPSAPGLCPPSPGWSPTAGTAVACALLPPAPAVSGAFRVASTPLALPDRCNPSQVERHIRAMLARLNAGRSTAFAGGFVKEGNWHPSTSTSSIGRGGSTGRTAIAHLARDRFIAGDGWTATTLMPPTGDALLPRSAVYGLEFQVANDGQPVGGGTSKIVVDCRSGLVVRWVGPALALPA